MLSRFSVVAFEPHVHGTVAAFEILDESPPQRRPLQPGEAAAASLADPSLDLSAAGGEVVSKEVTLRAEVRLPVEGTADRILTVTLERAVATSPRRIEGQWIVTAFREEAPR